MGTGKIPCREPTALRSTLRSHEFRPQGKGYLPILSSLGDLDLPWCVVYRLSYANRPISATLKVSETRERTKGWSMYPGRVKKVGKLSVARQGLDLLIIVEHGAGRVGGKGRTVT